MAITIKTIPTGQQLDQLSNVDTAGKATGDVLEWNAVTSKWEAATPSGSGVFGIPNSSGVYTYYSTLGAAITAASSGQTIEMFTSVTETGNVQINLKNGVNINFNGHTYTLNNAGTANAFSDNNVNLTCSLFNGRVVRQGGANNASDSCCLFIDNTASTVSCASMEFVNNNGMGAQVDGTLIGGYYVALGRAVNLRSGTLRDVEASSTAGDSIYVSGSAYDCKAIGFRGFRVVGGNLYNCVGVGNGTGNASQGIQAESSINAYDCSFISSGWHCLQVGNGTCFFANCSFLSTAFDACETNGGTSIFNNCSFNSSSRYGFNNGATSTLNNCSIRSTTNFGVNDTGTGVFRNCQITSTVNIAANSNGVIHNSSVVCDWNNSGGHGVRGNNNSIHNSTIQVTNASANCLNAAAATNSRYASNVFIGATTPVNANITQLVSNSEDSQGNILI
jgi:hypothetical protein